MTQVAAPKKFKICLLTISLAKGGAERSCAMLSQMLDKKGHKVTTVVLKDEIDFPFAGTIFNLGKLKSRNEGFFAGRATLPAFVGEFGKRTENSGAGTQEKTFADYLRSGQGDQYAAQVLPQPVNLPTACRGYAASAARVPCAARGSASPPSTPCPPPSQGPPSLRAQAAPALSRMRCGRRDPLAEPASQPRLAKVSTHSLDFP